MSTPTTTKRSRSVPRWERRLRALQRLALVADLGLSLNEYEHAVVVLFERGGRHIVGICATDDGVSSVHDPRTRRTLRGWRRDGARGRTAARNRVLDIATSEIVYRVALWLHWRGGLS